MKYNVPVKKGSVHKSPQPKRFSHNKHAHATATAMKK